MSATLIRCLTLASVILLANCEDRHGGSYIPERSYIEKWHPEFLDLFKEKSFTGLGGSHDIDYAIFAYNVRDLVGGPALEEVKQVLVSAGWEVMQESQGEQALRLLLIRLKEQPSPPDGWLEKWFMTYSFDMSAVVECRGTVLIGLIDIDASKPPVRQNVREDADRLYERQFAKFFEPQVRNVCGQANVEKPT